VPWLRREDEVLASIEARHRTDSGSGAVVVLRRPAIVRISGSRAVDVAWCSGAGSDEDGETVQVKRMGALGARMPVAPGLWMPVVIVAAGGSFDRWRLRTGDRLVITHA
jgi:hypothetical protein